MKQKSLFVVVMLGVLFLLMVTNASAQTSHELVADIPFDFTACQQQLPAGKYKVRPLSSSNPKLLLVRSEDNSKFAEIACVHDTQGSKLVVNGRLIFNRYGDEYFLSEMWFPGEKTGNLVVKSEKEEALLKEVAPRKKREKVTIKVTEVKPD